MLRALEQDIGESLINVTFFKEKHAKLLPKKFPLREKCDSGDDSLNPT